jgi:branched-chain amino acid transport system permease protein
MAQIWHSLTAPWRALTALWRALTALWQALTAPWQALPARERRIITWAFWIFLLLIFPLADKMFNWGIVNDVTDVLVLVILSLGLNIVVGYAGLLDLGYAAFFAIGAYTAGILTWPAHHLEWNFWIVIWAAVIVAAFFGTVIGTPTLRLRGDYLAIVTLAFGEIVPVVIRNLGDVSLSIGPWHLLTNFNLTNGVQGLNPVGRPSIFGFKFSFDPTPWYYLILCIVGLVILASSRLENSRLGRAWMALREDEKAADCMGVDPVRTKLSAFAIGASFSGFSGAFYAAKLQAIFPELFKFNLSVMILCMVILGGMGNIKGVVIGGMLLQLFDRVVLTQTTIFARSVGQALHISALATIDLSLWRWFFFGLAMVVIMVLRPEGLFPSAARRAELRAAEEETPQPAESG